ncbi:MAG TPA: coproporphyrinogen III oxidase, partial [Nitrospirae bacterium]|nr:coproporphyrinogen III oxidase [Nitrospirota bacterium]
RLHTAEEAEKAGSLAKEAGFKNIGIDLIYGIPGQSVNSGIKTLEKAVQLEPDHISTYELTVESGTLLYDHIEKGRLQGPEEEKIIEMYNHTIDFLTAKGFVHYEISNFSMPGYFCRHNLNYWDRGEYYGAGLGAHSFINGKRSYNTGDLEHYIQSLSKNELPVEGSEVITADKALLETFFLGLRKTEGINLEKLSASYGEDIQKVYEKQIRELQRAGLIETYSSSRGFGTSRVTSSGNNRMRLTRQGILLSNEVFIRFM